MGTDRQETGFLRELSDATEQGYDKQIEEIDLAFYSLGEKLTMELVEPFAQKVKAEITKMAKKGKIENKNGRKYIGYTMPCCDFSDLTEVIANDGILSDMRHEGGESLIEFPASKYTADYKEICKLLYAIPVELRSKSKKDRYLRLHCNDYPLYFDLWNLGHLDVKITIGKVIPFLQIGTVVAECAMSDLQKRFFQKLKEVLILDGIELLSVNCKLFLKEKCILKFNNFEEKYRFKKIKGISEYKTYDENMVDSINFRVLL